MPRPSHPLTPLFRLVALVLLLAGSPFATVGLYEGYEAWHETRSLARATGRVVANTYVTTQDGVNVSGAYLPEVEFTTASGHVVRFTDGVGSLPPDYAVGEAVAVLFDPAEPGEARIHSWKRVWLVPVILTAVGLLPALVFAGWMVGWCVARKTPQRA